DSGTASGDHCHLTLQKVRPEYFRCERNRHVCRGGRVGLWRSVRDLRREFQLQLTRNPEARPVMRRAPATHERLAMLLRSVAGVSLPAVVAVARGEPPHEVVARN